MSTCADVDERARRLPLERLHRPTDVSADDDLVTVQLRHLLGNCMDRREMVSFGVGADRVVVGHPLAHDVIQVFLAKQDELEQTLVRDRLDESLDAAVQVW